MLVSSFEVADILFCESLDISEAISDYGAQAFTLQSPRDSLPLVTKASPHGTSKEEDILHPHGHLLLRFGADFTVKEANLAFPTIKEANWSTPGMIWVTFMHLIANWGLLSVQPISYSQLRHLHALNILFNHYLMIIYYYLMN